MTYSIQKLGQLGDGITSDGLIAPLTLPEEHIEGRLCEDRLEDIKIISPSSERVKPPCSYFKRCGGCQMQHASENLVATWKTDIVTNLLRSAGLSHVIRAVQNSPANSRRRVSFTARRTKKSVELGFLTKSTHQLVNIETCILATDAINAVIPTLREIARPLLSRKSEIKLLVTDLGGALDVSISGAQIPTGIEGEIASLAHKAKISRITLNGELSVQHEPSILRLGAARVKVPAGSFLQATPQGEAAMQHRVTQILKNCVQVADLFSGVGTFTFPLAEHAPVDAYESSSEMVDALVDAANHTSDIKHVQGFTRDLFRRPLLPDELRRYDGIVIDPPRAGALAQINEIAKSRIPKIAFVSCNPKTFVRDAKVLCDRGYKIEWIDLIDQFKWSPHIELVAEISRS